MPPRPAIEYLPPLLIEQLDAKLIANGFSDYRSLASWLRENGYSISKDQVWRHARGLKEKYLEIRSEALMLSEMAKYQSEDKRGDLIAVATDIGIMKGIEAMTDLDPVEDTKKLADIQRATAALAKASLEQKKWAMISAAQLENQLKQIEADESTRDLPSSPQELINRIRQTVMGYLPSEL